MHIDFENATMQNVITTQNIVNYNYYISRCYCILRQLLQCLYLIRIGDETTRSICTNRPFINIMKSAMLVIAIRWSNGNGIRHHLVDFCGFRLTGINMSNLHTSRSLGHLDVFVNTYLYYYNGNLIQTRVC